MKKKFVLCFVSVMLLAVWGFCQERVEKERAEFLQLLKTNPNYFGTMQKTTWKAVKIVNTNTSYEETCGIGLYPEIDLLTAVVNVKKMSGYSGTLCTAGSFEYVRFYADWNSDGDFLDPGEDVGMEGINVHDIPGVTQKCLDILRPLSYAVSVKLNPEYIRCEKPYLVQIRAILSWNYAPPANDPNFIPVWGNIINKWIQIKPKPKFKIVTPYQLEKLEPLSKSKLLELYKPYKVQESRFDFKAANELALKMQKEPGIKAQYQTSPELLQQLKAVDAVLALKFNTTYEQLNCVGLDYDRDMLKATLTVKLPYGFLGDLCTAGSYEHVAFWLYETAPIPIASSCKWTYLGTASVNTHDIPGLPSDGLKYSVQLPVDFSKYKALCDKPRLFKIRAILSWDMMPNPADPNYTPPWGNRLDTVIQLKPGRPSEQGKQEPFLTFVGGKSVDMISGNPTTIIPSSIGDGYANGVNALESPFGGVISIAGRISNAPNYLLPGVSKLEYKIQYRKQGEIVWHDITNTYNLHISYWNGVSWIMTVQPQPAPGGYYMYEDNPLGQRFVEGSDWSGGCVLADWHTPAAEGDGLYELRMLSKEPAAPAFPDVPAGHRPSETIKIMVDNTAPEAKVSLNAGPCITVDVGTVVDGKLTATDTHFYQYTLSVLPPVGTPPVLSLTYESFPTVAAPGRLNWPFTLTTTATTTPCGYVLYLYVWDRTILNNHFVGNQKSDSVGLCIRLK